MKIQAMNHPCLCFGTAPTSARSDKQVAVDVVEGETPLLDGDFFK